MDNNIELITGNEIRHKTYFENNYIVDSLIKGNKVSILTGGSKTGKSTLALQLANSVSKGIPFLNNNTIQCDVLYICLDNDEDLIAENTSTNTYVGILNPVKDVNGLIRKKYEILVNSFKENDGIDLQAIGDAELK